MVGIRSFPIGVSAYFQGRLLLVSGRVHRYTSHLHMFDSFGKEQGKTASWWTKNRGGWGIWSLGEHEKFRKPKIGETWWNNFEIIPEIGYLPRKSHETCISEYRTYCELLISLATKNWSRGCHNCLTSFLPQNDRLMNFWIWQLPLIRLHTRMGFLNPQKHGWIQVLGNYDSLIRIPGRLNAC